MHENCDEDSKYEECAEIESNGKSIAYVVLDLLTVEINKLKKIVNELQSRLNHISFERKLKCEKDEKREDPEQHYPKYFALVNAKVNELQLVNKSIREIIDRLAI